jgi:hypothetical protein
LKHIAYKKQVFVTHTVPPTEIPALLNIWVTNTPVKMLCQRKLLFLYFRKNRTCLIVGLMRVGQAFSVSCKNVSPWVTTNCCFMSDLSPNLYICTLVYLSTHNIKVNTLCISLTLLVHLTFREPCIVIYSYNKAKEMH